MRTKLARTIKQFRRTNQPSDYCLPTLYENIRKRNLHCVWMAVKFHNLTPAEVKAL